MAENGYIFRCYEQLVSLKKRHPDRVVLLVGNRDVNKMRFTSELHDTEMDLRSMAKGWWVAVLCCGFVAALLH